MPGLLQCFAKWPTLPDTVTGINSLATKEANSAVEKVLDEQEAAQWEQL